MSNYRDLNLARQILQKIDELTHRSFSKLSLDDFPDVDLKSFAYHFRMLVQHGCFLNDCVQGYLDHDSDRKDIHGDSLVREVDFIISQHYRLSWIGHDLLDQLAANVNQ